MPEFQHQEYPENVSKIALMHRFVLSPQPVRKIFAEIAPLPTSGTAENVKCEIVQRPVLPEPNTIWQAESMLALCNDLRRQNACHRFFEQVTQSGSSHL